VRNVFCGAESGRRRTVHLVQDSTALILNVTAAQMSLSRAGIVLGWLFIALGATWIVTRVWPTLAPAGRVKLLAGVLAFALSLGMLVLGFGRDRLRGELDSLREASSSADARRTALSVNVRYELVRSALDIWTGNPWFGVGGWGFRYLLPYAQPVDDWQWTTGYGKSNVHNDSVQFLVEFGTVGAGLMTAAVAVLIAPVLRRTTRGRRVFQDDPAVFFAWMGGGLVLLHSLIDLPFRSPAILLLFILAWAGAGVLAKDCVQSTTSDRCLAPERTAR
jgi:O-antigen ligase